MRTSHEALLRFYRMEEHFQLLRHGEDWPHVWESTDPELTLTDPQMKSHQNIEGHRLQEEDTKSRDHERHQVHHRVWGQQHCKDLLCWRSAASHSAAELIRTGLQSVVAVVITAIWNTGRKSEGTFHKWGNISAERLGGGGGAEGLQCSHRVTNDEHTFCTASFAGCLGDEGQLVEERVLRDLDCFSLIEQTVVTKLAESAETRRQTHAVVSITQFVEGRLILLPWRAQKHNRTRENHPIDKIRQLDDGRTRN